MYSKSELAEFDLWRSRQKLVNLLIKNGNDKITCVWKDKTLSRAQRYRLFLANYRKYNRERCLIVAKANQLVFTNGIKPEWTEELQKMVNKVLYEKAEINDVILPVEKVNMSNVEVTLDDIKPKLDKIQDKTKVGTAKSVNIPDDKTDITTATFRSRQLGLRN